MTDLAKMMAPIRDTIARAREKMEQIERLMVTATEADKLECTSAAECAVEKARRLLAELNGKASHTVTLKPGHDHDDADPYMAVHSPADTIDRTLPPGFEVRECDGCWFPCKDIYGDECSVFFSEDQFWSPIKAPVTAWSRSCSYPTESAAYADKARWLKAAGVDWPEVTGPHEDGDYDIRTSTHWWNGDEWEKRDSQCDKIGFFQRPKKNAVRALPAARRAWVEMQKNKEKVR